MGLLRLVPVARDALFDSIASAVRYGVRNGFHAIAALVALSAGCHALDRARYHALLDVESTDAAVDGAADIAPCIAIADGGTTESGCALYVVPPRPGNARDLIPDGGDLIFAVRRLTFGFNSTSVWHGIGFDRDGYCTNPGTSPEQGCHPVGGASTVEDGEGGRDDSFATGIGALLSTVSFTEQGANDAISSGGRTLAARIRSYGGPTDAQVVIEWLPLMNGTASDGTSPLRWDGHDRWAIDARLAYDPALPGTPVIRSTTGYTTCGTLVARLPSRVPFRFSGAVHAVRLTLTGAVLAGAIDPSGRSLGPLDLSAAWALSDAMIDVGVLGICPPTDGGSSPMWNLTANLLRGSADVLSSGESTPAVECDAISAAFRVEFGAIDLRPDEMSPAMVEDLCAR